MEDKPRKLLRSIKIKGYIPEHIAREEEAMDTAALINDIRYLRQSDSIIKEALQKGFDVLQMANGDIVTTGTKIVTTTFRWDNDKGKLSKIKAGNGRRGRPRAEEQEEEYEEA